jgi:hypothetical protein
MGTYAFVESGVFVVKMPTKHLLSSLCIGNDRDHHRQETKEGQRFRILLLTPCNIAPAVDSRN